MKKGQDLTDQIDIDGLVPHVELIYTFNEPKIKKHYLTVPILLASES